MASGTLLDYEKEFNILLLVRGFLLSRLYTYIFTRRRFSRVAKSRVVYFPQVSEIFLIENETLLNSTSPCIPTNRYATWKMEFATGYEKFNMFFNVYICVFFCYFNDVDFFHLNPFVLCCRNIPRNGNFWKSNMLSFFQKNLNRYTFLQKRIHTINVQHAFNASALIILKWVLINKKSNNVTHIAPFLLTENKSWWAEHFTYFYKAACRIWITKLFLNQSL